MPTGYTAPLHDAEDITFEQFVLRCSRAMGAAVMQRDESLDVEIRLREVSDYELEAVTKARRELDEAFGRDDDEWSAIQEKEIREAIAARESYVSNKRAILSRYERMLAAVEEWAPPTAEHEGLKKFMVEQIEESIRFDCGDYEPSVPKWMPVTQFAEDRVAQAADRLQRAIKRLREERERVASQNAWVTQLRDSLALPTK